jgi:hypothetical protein
MGERERAERRVNNANSDLRWSHGDGSHGPAAHVPPILTIFQTTQPKLSLTTTFVKHKKKKNKKS